MGQYVQNAVSFHWGLYVVDAGDGHVAGHINVLARTSEDGGWIYLAGDSAHDRRLLTGPLNIHYSCHIRIFRPL